MEASDWYSVTRRQVIERGGMGLFNHHSSLEEALRAAYPEVEWETSRFSLEGDRIQPGYLKDAGNVRRFMESLGKSLGVTKVRNCLMLLLITDTYSRSTSHRIGMELRRKP